MQRWEKLRKEVTFKLDDDSDFFAEVIDEGDLSFLDGDYVITKEDAIRFANWILNLYKKA